MIAIIGVDPGKSGAFALRAPGIVETYPFELAESGEVSLFLCRAWVVSKIRILRISKLLVYIEAVHAMPKQGVGSMFSFGRTTGQLEGLFVGLGVGIKRITPQKWQALMHEGFREIKDPKERSAKAVKRIYPDLNLLATKRSKTPHKGIIDALLIADAAMKINAELFLVPKVSC